MQVPKGEEFIEGKEKENSFSLNVTQGLSTENLGLNEEDNSNLLINDPQARKFLP